MKMSSRYHVLFASFAISIALGDSFIGHKPSIFRRKLEMSSTPSLDAAMGKPTELPDSLDDAAVIAAEASAAFAKASGPASRCRVDFDTSVGDETYTMLKSSTEFMQKFVSALCYSMIPGLQARRQDEMMRVAKARSELTAMKNMEEEDVTEETKAKREKLINIISDGGVDPENREWNGPKARIYFPDEGSAALARRDWLEPADQAQVPPCVEFSSCGGVQVADVSKDTIVFFFCPRASESDSVEELLQNTEEKSTDLQLIVMVNPLLVDMGVTGFGMAGRMLRERLIDNLVNTYYLRTLAWGALTRTWPRSFSVWQEDADAEGGYKLLQNLDQLPSNPEVEDIYDLASGNKGAPQEGFGVLNALGDFVNGMMKL